MRKTMIKRHKGIPPISKRRKAELREYYILENKLRQLCGNKSELSGAYADWQTHWNVEGHHITGRNGKRLLDPFNIIMLVRDEHTIEQRYLEGCHTEEELLAIVRPIRIKQGFEEV